jgi:hypothetical protein
MRRAGSVETKTCFALLASRNIHLIGVSPRSMFTDSELGCSGISEGQPLASLVPVDEAATTQAGFQCNFE